jgi:hypothetical protein
MHIWSSLTAREAALLGILLLVGAGPASFLSKRFDAAGRIAMAPALGFCLATCVTTTLLYFAPTNETYWALIPLAGASMAVAVARTARGDHSGGWRTRLRLRDLTALIIIGLAVTGPLTAVLHSHHTVGPGAYYFTDVDNYIGVQDAARTASLQTAHQSWQSHAASGARWSNYTQFIWSFFSQVGSNLDATPLDSNVNALINLSAVDTFAPFLSVLLLMGGLGAFAAVRYFAGSRTTVAALAGCMFGGALFVELWFDSYQAVIIAMGLLMPLVVLLDHIRAGPRRTDLVLIALLIGTFLSVYPLYVPIIVVSVGLVGLWELWRLRRAGRALRPLIGPIVLSMLAVAFLAMVFDLVAVFRDIHYYGLLARNELPLPRVGFSLPVSVLPGWLAQTREFWVLGGLWSGGLKQIVLGILLPLVFLSIAVVGLRRYPAAACLIVFAVVAAAVAEYTYASQQNCTYCAERDLLALAPIVSVLIALGLCALLAMSTRWAQVAALIGGVLLVVSVGQRVRIELRRFSEGSYFLPSANREVVSALPRGKGAVELEGFEAGAGAQAEQPLMYHYVNYREPGRTSIIAGSDVGNAISYLDFGVLHLPPGPEFDPAYQYVLTRLPAIATARQVIAREPGVALERRTQPLDITPYAGLATPLSSLDPDGTAWVQPQYPLQMYIVGRDGGRPAWGRLTFHSTVAVVVPRQPGVRSDLSGDTLTVCVRATGSEPVRSVNLSLRADVVPGPTPAEMFPPAMPLEGLSLASMRAVTGGCSVRG